MRPPPVPKIPLSRLLQLTRNNLLGLRATLDACGAVWRADGFGLRRHALAQVDRQDGHRSDGEELGLPVLQRAFQKSGEIR